MPRSYEFHGSHNGYRHLRGRPVHERTIECDLGRNWRVTDEILGTGEHTLESYIHFHPSFHIRESDGGWHACNEAGEVRYRISVTAGKCEMLQTDYCPAFGIRHKKDTLRLRITAALPTSFSYLIEVA
jgi:hypothetical protein